LGRARGSMAATAITVAADFMAVGRGSMAVAGTVITADSEALAQHAAAHQCVEPADSVAGVVAGFAVEMLEASTAGAGSTVVERPMEEAAGS
jgi:hypothetical protein